MSYHQKPPSDLIPPKGSCVIGITLGDAAGIGPEVVEQALHSGRLSPDFEYRIIGSCPGAEPGKPTPETALAALASMEEAAALVAKGEIGAIVTSPIHKYRMQSIGFPYPGHTEFFAARAGVQDYAMLLTGGSLTVALVTIHVALGKVPELITSDEIFRVGCLLRDFVRRRLKRPVRIAVAGLNPHAGESGTMGDEEVRIIEPAIERLWKRFGPDDVFTGPASPDTVFYRAIMGNFDAVLCMYHDQALIPLKLHAFDSGVNVTLGLPFVRTSPDHGTAFDIAGRNIANPASMIAAINLAAKLLEPGEIEVESSSEQAGVEAAERHL